MFVFLEKLVQETYPLLYRKLFLLTIFYTEISPMHFAREGWQKCPQSNSKPNVVETPNFACGLVFTEIFQKIGFELMKSSL